METTASLASIPHDARPVPAVDVPPVDVPAVLTALGALAATGLVAGLGSGDGLLALRLLPALPVAFLGTATLTALPLAAAAALSGVPLSADAVVVSMARAAVRAGRIAVGFLPALLFVSATTNAWLPVWLATAALAAVAALGTGRDALIEATGERAAIPGLWVANFGAGLALIFGSRLFFQILDAVFAASTGAL